MVHEFKVGDYAQGIEDGWVGRIERIYDDPIIIDHDTPPIPCLMAEMTGVDTFVMLLTGEPASRCLAGDDTQFRALDDMVPYK